MKQSPQRSRARSARRRSGPITRPTCAASRSAAPRRTCWRSRRASCTGRKLGASATAALVTRGFAELARFGRALGARSETLTGLSGLGDLILTCSSPQSRNFSLGIALGEGRAPEGKLAEGAFTARALVELAGEKGVEMPIATAVAAVIEETLTVDQAIEGLLTRPFRAE